MSFNWIMQTLFWVLLLTNTSGFAFGFSQLIIISRLGIIYPLHMFELFSTLWDGADISWFSNRLWASSTCHARCWHVTSNYLIILNICLPACTGIDKYIILMNNLSLILQLVGWLSGKNNLFSKGALFLCVIKEIYSEWNTE